MEKERKRGGALKGNRLETEKGNREGGKGNEEGGVRYLKRMDWKQRKGIGKVEKETKREG